MEVISSHLEFSLRNLISDAQQIDHRAIVYEATSYDVMKIILIVT